MKKQVVVHSYEKIWADDFVKIRDELNTVLKDLVLWIEHKAPFIESIYKRIGSKGTFDTHIIIY